MLRVLPSPAKQALTQLLGRARASFYISRWEIDRQLKADPRKMTVEERAEFSTQKLILGSYWYEPREIWARLFEQFISTRLGRGGWSVYPDYNLRLAYWGADEWKMVEPLVDEAIRFCLKTLRTHFAGTASPHAEDGQ